MEWSSLGGIDIAMLGVVALSAIVGLFRGLTFELLSLAGWFVAFFAARWIAPELAPHLPVGELGSALNQGAAFACAFFGVLLLWGLLSKAVSMLIKATPLRPLDRLLGMAFGVLRAAVVLLVIATLIGYTPAARSPAWRASAGAAMLESVLHGLLPLLPAALPPGRNV